MIFVDIFYMVAFFVYDVIFSAMVVPVLFLVSFVSLQMGGFHGQMFALQQSFHTFIMIGFLAGVVVACAFQLFLMGRLGIGCDDAFVVSQDHFAR